MKQQSLMFLNSSMTKHNLYTEAFFITRKHIHRIKDGFTHSEKNHDYRYWNTAFARQHLVKTDGEDKVRLVFGAPFTLLTSELMFIWPLQVHLLTMTGKKNFMLWKYETMLGGWYRLRNYFATHAPRSDTIVTLDWSGFDRYARHSVIRDIHQRIIRPIFTFDEGYHPTRTNPTYEDADRIKPRLENLWSWMTDSVLSVPLLMPDGTMIRFIHSGIFSGYFQTQILDSLYNMVKIFTILSRMGFDLDKIVLKVQGDDSIIALLCCFLLIVTSFMTLFKQYASYYFGAVVSDKKSNIQKGLDDAEVLKYRNKNGIPYRDRCSLLAQLRHPERSITPDVTMSRCIGIAYAACGQDPLVYAVCEDVYRFLEREGVTPNRKSLDLYMSQRLGPFGEKFDYSTDQFPTFYETVTHLLDNERPLENKHWPLDYFNGLPGQS